MNAHVVSRRAFFGSAGAAILIGCSTSPGRRAASGSVRHPVLYDEHGGLFIDASVNGRGPSRFILDTGASRSALSEAFARELGLDIGEGGEVEGTAGTVKVGSAVAQVDVSTLASLDIDFTIHAFASYDPKCVGILGSEFLRLAPFQIRHRDDALLWNAPRPHPSSRLVPMALDNSIPRIKAIVNDQTVDLRIDTGAALRPSEASYVNLTQDQAAAAGLTGAPDMVFRGTGTGGATLELPVFPLRSFRVADRTIPKAFAIVQPRVGYFARADAVGFLGNSVLEKVDPFFDYPGGMFGVGA